MDDYARLDGSDAPARPVETPAVYAKFKDDLKTALHSLEAFDQASFAMLKHDEEYRQAVERFLVPLTATPMSELVEQVMKSGLDFISSRISAQIALPPSLNSLVTSSVSPQPRTSSNPPRNNHSTPQASSPTSTSSFQGTWDGPYYPGTGMYVSPALTRMSDVPQRIPSAPKPSIPAPHSPSASFTIQLQSRTTSPTPQESLSQGRGTTRVAWLHLLSGNWQNGMDPQRVASDLNEEIYHCQRRRTSSRGYRGGRPPPSFHRKGRYVIDARLTKGRSAIALTRVQDHQGHTRRDFLTALKKVIQTISGGSASVFLREGGRDMYVLRLECAGPYSMQDLVKCNLNGVCVQLKQYLQKTCGMFEAVNKVRKLDLFHPADAPDGFSYFLAEVDFFFPLPAQKKFQINFGSAGG